MKDLSRFTRSEINAIFDKARCLLRHTGLTILCVPATKEYGRILVITPRKVGNSPKRNRIRRRLKALFYEEKLYEQGLDCAIIIKPAGTNLEHSQLKELLLKAFQNATSAKKQ